MPAMVTIGKDGNIYLQYEDYKDSEPLSREKLEEVLSGAQKQAEQENKQLTVLVNGDKSRPYGEVVSLMASLQEAGLTQVGLLTEPLK
jgi:biopolymer transport protein TolR